MKPLIFLLLFIATSATAQVDTIYPSQCKCEVWDKYYDKCLLALTPFAYFSASEVVIPVSFKSMKEGAEIILDNDAKIYSGKIQDPYVGAIGVTWLKSNCLSTAFIYFLRERKPRA